MAIDAVVSWMSGVPYVGTFVALLATMLKNPTLALATLVVTLLTVALLYQMMLPKRVGPIPVGPHRRRMPPQLNVERLTRDQKDVCLNWWTRTFPALPVPADWTTDHLAATIVEIGARRTQVDSVREFWRTYVAPLTHPIPPPMPVSGDAKAIVRAFKIYGEKAIGFNRRNLGEVAAARSTVVVEPPEVLFVRRLRRDFVAHNAAVSADAKVRAPSATVPTQADIKAVMLHAMRGESDTQVGLMRKYMLRDTPAVPTPTGVNAWSETSASAGVIVQAVQAVIRARTEVWTTA